MQYFWHFDCDDSWKDIVNSAVIMSVDSPS